MVSLSYRERTSPSPTLAGFEEAVFAGLSCSGEQTLVGRGYHSYRERTSPSPTLAGPKNWLSRSLSRSGHGVLRLWGRL
jgi:hypothetical protein